MKYEKITNCLLSCILITACGKSDEEKLNDLIAEAIKANLYIPESYDPVSLKCDTLGKSIITNTNIKKVTRFVEVMEEADDLQCDYEFNNELEELLTGQNIGSYNKYSQKAQSAETKKTEMIEEARSILSDLYKQYYAPTEFNGFVAYHKFRAKNNLGQVNFGEYIFILNKDKSEILLSLDVRDERVIEFIQFMAALHELGDGININDMTDLELFSFADNLRLEFE